MLQRSDFTLNKDIDEECPSPVSTVESPGSDSKVAKNMEGEISDLDALQKYLAEKYESILHPQSRESPKGKAAAKANSKIFAISFDAENSQKGTVEVDEGIVEELESAEAESCELSCSILSGMKEYVPGLLRISSSFLSFEPTGPELVNS